MANKFHPNSWFDDTRELEEDAHQHSEFSHIKSSVSQSQDREPKYVGVKDIATSQTFNKSQLIELTGQENE